MDSEGVNVRRLTSSELLKYDALLKLQNAKWQNFNWEEVELIGGSGSSKNKTSVNIISTRPAYRQLLHAQITEVSTATLEKVENGYCDVNFVVDDGMVPVHKVFFQKLKYLKALLDTAHPFENSVTITLCGVKVRHLRIVLSLLYTGQTVYNIDEEKEVTSLLEILQMNRLKLEKTPYEPNKMSKKQRPTIVSGICWDSDSASSTSTSMVNGCIEEVMTSISKQDMEMLLQTSPSAVTEKCDSLKAPSTRSHSPSKSKRRKLREEAESPDALSVILVEQVSGEAPVDDRKRDRDSDPESLFKPVTSFKRKQGEWDAGKWDDSDTNSHSEPATSVKRKQENWDGSDTDSLFAPVNVSKENSKRKTYSLTPKKAKKKSPISTRNLSKRFKAVKNARQTSRTQNVSQGQSNNTEKKRGRPRKIRNKSIVTPTSQRSSTRKRSKTSKYPLVETKQSKNLTKVSNKDLRQQSEKLNQTSSKKEESPLNKASKTRENVEEVRKSNKSSTTSDPSYLSAASEKDNRNDVAELRKRLREKFMLFIKAREELSSKNKK